MTATNTFNATEWIARNTHGGTELSADARDAIAGFTTMWNFFESTLCNNRASLAAFERALERFQSDQVPPATSRTLDACLAFWKFRYRTPDGFGHLFEGLYFRPSDKRAHVEAVLEGTATNPDDKVLALMIIIYRLRNNLFHGLKTLEMLNDQVQNLVNASRCLAAILEAIPSRFVPAHRLNAASR